MDSVCTNRKFLYSSFYGYTNQDVINFFETHGMKTKTERGDRVFPLSDKSADVIDTLRDAMKKSGVKVHLHTEVESNLLEDTAEKERKKKILGIKLKNGTEIPADRVLVATGGLSYKTTGSTGDGYRFAESAGHKVTELSPSLVPFNTREEYGKRMQGLSLKNVTLSVLDGKKCLYEDFGEMMFTHFGVTGPLVLTASTAVLKKLRQKELRMEIDLKPALSEEQLDARLLREFGEGNPVTIRFLDPPLHEFVPQTDEDIQKLADSQGKTVEQIKGIIDSLHEFNPMMGHRGVRLAVTYPEIAKMQTRAVIRAAINVKKKHPDWSICPEIMIPLIGDDKELRFVKKTVVDTANEEIAAAGADLKYQVGTMIEIPRAALTADEIAKDADFFCFGTNDLTQMTFGFSRDDAGKFLEAYYERKIFENDPFAKLDQNGVGKLMEMAIQLGKGENPNLHIGICGEHGGDPSSVEFCHKIGLDYVSCSPFRVPIARLAAAQAAIAEMK